MTRERVVDAAAELVAEEGLDGLSMRKLARRCGVGAMTLYGHVRTKEELLGELASRFLGEIELPEDAEETWQEQVARVFRLLRRVFLEHPELLPIVATQRLDAIGVYRAAELVFAALRSAGLDERQTVEAFDALTSYTIGTAQREAGLRGRDADALPGISKLSPQEFPNAIGLAGHLVTRDPERSFETGLDLLVRGIASWTEAR